MIFLLKQVGGGISKGLFVHLERSSTSGFWSSSSHLFSSKLMQPANIETTKENPHGSEVLRGATSWENAFNILLTKPWTPEGSSFSGKTCVIVILDSVVERIVIFNLSICEIIAQIRLQFQLQSYQLLFKGKGLLFKLLKSNDRSHLRWGLSRLRVLFKAMSANSFEHWNEAFRSNFNFKFI